MYNEKATMAMPSQEKEPPYHISQANKAFDELVGLGHKEQVEAFKHLQKRICDFRYETCKNATSELEKFHCDLKEHFAGTDQIAAAL